MIERTARTRLESLASDFFDGLLQFKETAKVDPLVTELRLVLAYGGDEWIQREGVDVVGWLHLQAFLGENVEGESNG
jgi:hypothetical protein